MGKSCFDIPEELVIEVLSRLPLKTLARFKCVSKQWQHLISNTIDLTNPKLLIFSSLEDSNTFSFHSLNRETYIESTCSPGRGNSLQGRHKIIVHSSCNGLILIQIDNYDDLFMWNPLTKFIRKVLTYDGLSEVHSEHFLVAELCYDSTTGVYKVVLVEKYCSYSWMEEYFYVAICGDSSWEKIQVPYTIDNVHLGPFFKGYRHWVCTGHPRDQFDFDGDFFYANHIVYFDPQTNEFIELPMPQPKKDGDISVNLGILDGCLCMTRWDEPGNYEGNIEFLVMKEYGNGDSWDLLFVISNIPDEFRCYSDMNPLFKTKKGEILVSVFISHRNKSIKSYDSNGNFLRDILLPTNNDNFRYIMYEESWFSPTDHDWEQILPFDSDSSSDFADVSEEVIGYDSEESDNEEYTQCDLSELESSIKEVYPSRKKKRDKKKSHHMIMIRKKMREHMSGNGGA